MSDDESALRKFDVIEIDSYRYIVYNIGKINISLISIEELLSGIIYKHFIPTLFVKKEHISKYTKLDKDILFYLMNHSDSKIKKVISNFLEDDKETGG